jgi:L-fuconolactonase
MILDAHHHLWRTSRGDYGWIPPGHPILDRSYLPADFLEARRGTLVRETVLVQAAPTAAETEYLLGAADASSEILGVVGWIDFEDRSERAKFERFAQHPKFRSVRPMLQDIQDDDWILSPSIAWALDAIEEFDMAFDALGYTRHGPRILKLANRRPNMRIVLDHALKPPIKEGATSAAFKQWAAVVRELATETNVFCKLSGLVTEAGPEISEDILRPWVQHLFECFGTTRIMWGSDWPVSRLRLEYSECLALSQALCADLSEAERNHVFHRTAYTFYRLKSKANI